MSDVLKDDEVRALYRSPLWSDDALRALREAFWRDAANGADLPFCLRRIHVIEQVLRERQEAHG